MLSPMADDERQIRELIERWANAVHTGDLEAVLAEHDASIVMFDVPPPNDGVRGIDAYRETWPPFFEWQRQGAMFELDTLEVTAGDDVAFAVRAASVRHARGTRRRSDEAAPAHDRPTKGERNVDGDARAPLVPDSLREFLI